MNHFIPEGRIYSGFGDGFLTIILSSCLIGRDKESTMTLSVPLMYLPYTGRVPKREAGRVPRKELFWISSKMELKS